MVSAAPARLEDALVGDTVADVVAAEGAAPPVGPDGRPWHRTRVQGRSATYALAGDPADAGLPVVLLHGWGLGHRPYQAAIQHLVDLGCLVYAPALPGFGGTTGLSGRDAGIEGYADWVADFIDEMAIDEPVLLLGHSFGGGVSIATAHRHPDKVSALVLVNSIGGATWRVASEDTNELTLADRPWWDWGIHFPRDLLPVNQGRRVLPVVLREALPNLLRNPVAMYRAGELARTADLTDELEELKRRRLPVMVLWGSRDGVIPRASFEALCQAVGSEGKVVEGTHSWLLADPKAFGEVITNAVDVARLAREASRRPVEPAEGQGSLRLRDRVRGGWRRWRARGPARRATRTFGRG